MSETSPRLDLPLVMPAQAQKHVTVNEALLRLDALVQCVAESRTLSAQPAAPPDGQAWLLPVGASGDDWSAFSAGDLALWRDGTWQAITPQVGWSVHVRDEALDVTWRDDGWQGRGADTELAVAENGAATRAIVLEETLSDLDGFSVSTSVHIPARCVVFCVSVRTRTAITGAASFDCGIAGEASKFGGSLGIDAGASNLGVIGPTAFYSDTPVVLTANGGEFSGGEVELAIHALVPVAPV